MIQRADVDNFFGSAVEADFAHGIKLRASESFEEQIGYVLRHNPKSSRFQWHLAGPDDEQYGDTRVFRINDQRVGIASRHNIPEGDVQLGYSYDLRYATLLTCLHSAHLGNFRLMGYRYAATMGAAFTASLLADVFRSFNSKPRKDIRESDVAEKCVNFKNMVRPLTSNVDDLYPKLVSDPFNWFVVAWYKSGRFGGRHLPFGCIHFLRTGDVVHGVVSFNLDRGTSLPVMSFCSANTAVSFEYSLGHYLKDQGAVEVGPPKGNRMMWPCGDNSKDEIPLTIELVAKSFLEMAVAARGTNKPPAG